MFEALGRNVKRLHRIREADLSLGNLKSGKYRRLSKDEVMKLKRYLDRGND